MKYLKWFWKILYWSCIWYIGLCFVVLFTIPDHLTGFVLAVFVAPFFGVLTAVIKSQKAEKSLHPQR